MKKRNKIILIVLTLVVITAWFIPIIPITKTIRFCIGYNSDPRVPDGCTKKTQTYKTLKQLFYNNPMTCPIDYEFSSYYEECLPKPHE